MTVSFEEAIHLINANNPLVLNRTSEEPFVTPDLENIYHEPLTEAIRQTSQWFMANPYATKQQVGNKLDNNILYEMSKFGGKMTQTPPFSIRSPAPYLVSFDGIGNCL